MSRINNLLELNETISNLENKVANLEKDNQNLRKWINYFDEEVVKVLPSTQVLSKSFISRSFAIWGHHFVANFIISAILSIIFFFVYIFLLGNLLHGIGGQVPVISQNSFHPTATPWVIKFP
jgi:hypothetical protein